jgi:hypothetical protein
MLRVLVCSQDDLRTELAPTPIGRQGIDLYRAAKFDDARLLMRTLGIQLVLIDREMPRAAGFIEKLRADDATRTRSIAVIARGDFREDEIDLLEAGANAILRLPADASWSERLPKLLTVPVRQEARIPVHLEIDMEADAHGEVVNLSAGGMLLATPRPLRLHDEVGFRFDVPTGGTVKGRARVMREAPGAGWGLEFVQVGDDDRVTLGQYLRSARLG